MANVKPKVLVTVTNDVSTDQRVHKISNYLVDRGFEVIVYGRILPSTFEVSRSYTIVRKKHLFNNNFLFYAEYNIRLLLFLLTNKSVYILSNDLDTLPACFIASRLKKIELVYDSHEFFTEVPELQGRKFVRTFWRFIERLLLPRLKKSYTVSESIASAYAKEYGIEMGVIRNVPYLNTTYSKEEVTFPTKNKVLLYQGTLTVNRGLKQTIQALKYLENIDLVIIGYGKEKESLVNFTQNENMTDRVYFLGRIPHKSLHNYTKQAHIGILLEEPVGASFNYSLPNKLFDYIHSELPILAYPLVEIKKIISEHKVGVFIENHEPKHIAKIIKELIEDENLTAQIKENQQKIKEIYCWENEQQKLDVYFNRMI